MRFNTRDHESPVHQKQPKKRRKKVEKRNETCTHAHTDRTNWNYCFDCLFVSHSCVFIRSLKLTSSLCLFLLCVWVDIAKKLNEMGWSFIIIRRIFKTKTKHTKRSIVDLSIVCVTCVDVDSSFCMFANTIPTIINHRMNRNEDEFWQTNGKCFVDAWNSLEMKWKTDEKWAKCNVLIVHKPTHPENRRFCIWITIRTTKTMRWLLQCIANQRKQNIDSIIIFLHLSSHNNPTYFSVCSVLFCCNRFYIRFFDIALTVYCTTKSIK